MNENGHRVRLGTMRPMFSMKRGPRIQLPTTNQTQIASSPRQTGRPME